MLKIDKTGNATHIRPLTIFPSEKSDIAQKVVIFAYSSIQGTVTEQYALMCNVLVTNLKGVYSCISLNDLIPNLSNNSDGLGNPNRVFGYQESANTN